jgi:hypothetical protein
MVKINRKILYFISSVLFIAIIGLAAYFLINKRSKVTSDAIRSIPIDAAIVVKVNNFAQLVNELHKENEFWQALKGFNLVSKADNFFELAESVRAKSEPFNHLIYNNTVFLSAHTVGKGTQALFFTANITERVRPTEVYSLLSEETAEKYNVTEKDYDGIKIYTYSLKNSDLQESFYLAVHQGIAMMSSSLLLVESALSQLETGISLVENRAFMEALRTAGTRIVANVLINHTRIPAFFNDQIHTAKKQNFQLLANAANWSELDLTIKNDAFYLNGFTQTSDTLNNFYNIFTKQKPVKIQVPTVLPSQTAALVFFGISDINAYFESYRRFIERQGKLQGYNQKLSREEKIVGVNYTNLFTSIFGKELALAYIPFEGESKENCWFALFETQSQSHALQELLRVIERYAQSTNQAASSFERTFAVDREKSVKIYRFPKAGMHETLFGSVFEIVNDQYFTFIDSYVVFGSSVESLSRLILANIHNKQLAVEKSFIEFSQSLSVESNFMAYINPGKAESLFGQKLNPSSAARLLSRIETVQKFQGIAIQLTGGKGMVFNNITARYTPYSADAPQTVWETRLDTAFRMKPHLVINHTTQNREIFVQDEKNSIYLINEVGRVLWRRPLPESIMGDVQQIDAFRNGKLQYIFNTKTHLYLIDRNGNNVDGFPAKLRSTATNPVAVFDYENNRDYRFFIAGEDRKIYVYNRTGNVIPGWDFDRSEKIVSKPIQHFRVGGRDYIVFADENRTYILDRRGSERVKPQTFFSIAQNSTFVLEDNSSRNSARLVTTDSLGLVRFIYFDGKVEEKPIKKVGNNHFFDFQDVNGDGIKDFIFLDGNQLFVYKHDGKELFSKKFQHNLLPQVIYFHFGSRDRKLGVTCSVSSQIYLINGDGNFYKGFPLKGTTPFSIGRFTNSKTTFNLIVGSSAGYVLNYAVQ